METETKLETLTKEEAIAKGFTHFVEEEGEHIVKLDSVEEVDKEYYKERTCYIVDMTNPKSYCISPDEIKELISDHVAGQEEMADEDDKLVAITEAHDYSTIAAELNAKFASLFYYEPIDILVTF